MGTFKPEEIIQELRDKCHAYERMDTNSNLYTSKKVGMQTDYHQYHYLFHPMLASTHTDKLVTEFHICRCMVCSDFEVEAEH
jgi:hypothetical protein